jgi:hypothetical protein
VKTNVGHTGTTSGLASIIKVALALEKGQIPPSANFEKPNEEIDLDDWHMKVRDPYPFHHLDPFFSRTCIVVWFQLGIPFLSVYAVRTW